MLYGDALKAISDNNHSGLSDDIVLAMACRESKLRPGSSNAVSTAKGLIGVTRFAVKDLRDRGGFDFSRADLLIQQQTSNWARVIWRCGSKTNMAMSGGRWTATARGREQAMPHRYCVLLPR